MGFVYDPRVPAWNHWYHVTSWTYGQWLRGDPRGWRARHHREHCDGDYKRRPDPMNHADQLRLSRALMHRPPVLLAERFRQTVADAIADRLIEFDVDVLIVAMGAKHLHALAKFPVDDPRLKLGIAKQAATKALKALSETNGVDFGLKLGDGIWAKRSRAEPVTGRGHQNATLKYVIGHFDDGAAIWLAPTLRPKFDSILAEVRAKRGGKAHG